MERPYIAKEVEGLSQKELIALVRRQINKWRLTPGKLSNANKTELKSKLLDPKYGFTTDKPPIPGTDLVPGGSTAGPSATTALTVDNRQVEPSPVPENGGTVLVTREIRLFIDDRRASYPIHTMQRVRVRFVDTADCRENEWRADASEILLALQKSISSITGSAKIGTPDRLNSSYTEYFVEIIANQLVETLAVSPELVVISEDNQLTLRVDALLCVAEFVSRHSPNYDLFDRSCFYYARTIFNITRAVMVSPVVDAVDGFEHFKSDALKWEAGVFKGAMAEQVRRDFGPEAVLQDCRAAWTIFETAVSDRR
ncbi:hypothetical protein B0H16DRAFT_1887515 [Mycena metata]|uniref:Uncharacterized protein n=1 Tax=Mycena metata TaxID=1033252 RepID=A0AAD7IVI1_9AGAR|nr:hypothetical protein B0H16DRAFT_1887515 [Mycena metata]